MSATALDLAQLLRNHPSLMAITQQFKDSPDALQKLMSEITNIANSSPLKPKPIPVSEKVDNAVQSIKSSIVDPARPGTQCEGLIFACLVLLVAIILLSIGLLYRYNEIQQDVAAALVNNNLTTQCQEEFEAQKKSLTILTGFLMALSFIELLLASIFMHKSRVSQPKFMGKGISLLVVSLAIFVCTIICLVIANSVSVTNICSKSWPAKTGYNTSMSMVIFAAAGVLVTGFVLNRDAINSAFKKK